MHALIFLSLTIKDDLGPVYTYPYSFEKATFFLLRQKNSRPFVALSHPLILARPHVQANSADVIVYIFPH